MPWIRIKDCDALVYEPARAQGPKKHDCTDCHVCQWCSDDRCAVCLAGKKPCKARRRNSGAR